MCYKAQNRESVAPDRRRRQVTAGRTIRHDVTAHGGALFRRALVCALIVLSLIGASPASGAAASQRLHGSHAQVRQADAGGHPGARPWCSECSKIWKEKDAQGRGYLRQSDVLATMRG